MLDYGNFVDRDRQRGLTAEVREETRFRCLVGVESRLVNVSYQRGCDVGFLLRCRVVPAYPDRHSRDSRENGYFLPFGIHNYPLNLVISISLLSSGKASQRAKSANPS